MNKRIVIANMKRQLIILAVSAGILAAAQPESHTDLSHIVDLLHEILDEYR